MKTGGPLLVVDTATTRAVVALGTPDGALIAQRSWVAGYRHGEELLTQIEGLLRDAHTAPADLGGLIAGTGPGAFTGLRVGLATVKGLAFALELPVVGVATARAILGAARRTALPTGVDDEPAAGSGTATLVLLQPAGPSDRVLSRFGEPSRILPGGTEPDLRPGELVVALDLEGRAPDQATAAGEAARAGLAEALLAAGADRLARGEADDLAMLVPEYVTLPRGVPDAPPGSAVEVSVP